MNHHRKTNWIRCRRGRACPICGRPDWCMVASDGSAALCARIESDKPAGNLGAGWVHRLDHHRAILRPWTTPPKSKRPPIDWEAFASRYASDLSDEGLDYIASELGLTSQSLRLLGVGWSPSQQFSTWPMRNAAGKIVGIRTRSSGDKRSITGSDGSGLFFVPENLTAEYLLICEGPTDTAALMDCGFGSVVGRPNCSAGTNYIVAIINALHPDVVLLVPDRDDAGLSGFAELAVAIVSQTWLPRTALDAITPPKGSKDVRQWKENSREHLARTITANLENIKQRIGDASNE